MKYSQLLIDYLTREKYLSRLISKYYYIFIVFFFFLCCNNKYQRGDYKRTVRVCNDMFIETYRTFGGGAWGSDLVDDYFTDSINFRVRIGNTDEYYGGFYYHCNNDSMIIEEFSRSSDQVRHSLGSKSYDIKKLKSLHNISQLKIKNINGK